MHGTDQMTYFSTFFDIYNAFYLGYPYNYFKVKIIQSCFFV